MSGGAKGALQGVLVSFVRSTLSRPSQHPASPISHGHGVLVSCPVPFAEAWV